MVRNVAGGAVGQGVVDAPSGDTADPPVEENKPEQSQKTVEDDDSDEDFGLSLFD